MRRLPRKERERGKMFRQRSLFFKAVFLHRRGRRLSQRPLPPSVLLLFFLPRKKYPAEVEEEEEKEEEEEERAIILPVLLLPLPPPPAFLVALNLPKPASKKGQR